MGLWKDAVGYEPAPDVLQMMFCTTSRDGYNPNGYGTTFPIYLMLTLATPEWDGTFPEGHAVYLPQDALNLKIGGTINGMHFDDVLGLATTLGGFPGGYSYDDAEGFAARFGVNLGSLPLQARGEDALRVGVSLEGMNGVNVSIPSVPTDELGVDDVWTLAVDITKRGLMLPERFCSESAAAPGSGMFPYAASGYGAGALSGVCGLIQDRLVAGEPQMSYAFSRTWPTDGNSLTAADIQGDYVANPYRSPVRWGDVQGASFASGFPETYDNRVMRFGFTEDCFADYDEWMENPTFPVKMRRVSFEPLIASTDGEVTLIDTRMNTEYAEADANGLYSVDAHSLFQADFFKYMRNSDQLDTGADSFPEGAAGRIECPLFMTAFKWNPATTFTYDPGTGEQTETPGWDLDHYITFRIGHSDFAFDDPPTPKLKFRAYDIARGEFTASEVDAMTDMARWVDGYDASTKIGTYLGTEVERYAGHGGYPVYKDPPLSGDTVLRESLLEGALAVPFEEMLSLPEGWCEEHGVLEYPVLASAATVMYTLEVESEYGDEVSVPVGGLHRCAFSSSILYKLSSVRPPGSAYEYSTYDPVAPMYVYGSTDVARMLSANIGKAGVWGLLRHFRPYSVPCTIGGEVFHDMASVQAVGVVPDPDSEWGYTNVYDEVPTVRGASAALPTLYIPVMYVTGGGCRLSARRGFFEDGTFTEDPVLGKALEVSATLSRPYAYGSWRDGVHADYEAPFADGMPSAWAEHLRNPSIEVGHQLTDEDPILVTPDSQFIYYYWGAVNLDDVETFEPDGPPAYGRQYRLVALSEGYLPRESRWFQDGKVDAVGAGGWMTPLMEVSVYISNEVRSLKFAYLGRMTTTSSLPYIPSDTSNLAVVLSPSYTFPEILKSVADPSGRVRQTRAYRVSVADVDEATMAAREDEGGTHIAFDFAWAIEETPTQKAPAKCLVRLYEGAAESTDAVLPDDALTASPSASATFLQEKEVALDGVSGFTTVVFSPPSDGDDGTVDAFDPKKQYTVVAGIADAYTHEAGSGHAKAGRIVPIAVITLSAYPGGEGLAVGKLAKRKGFEVAMDLLLEMGFAINIGHTAPFDRHAPMAAFGTANPKIEFQNPSGSQRGQLVFTDYDSVASGVSLSFVSDQPHAALRANNMVTMDGTVADMRSDFALDKTANNGTSAWRYFNGHIFYDKNDQWFAAHTADLNDAGRVMAGVKARNMKADGTYVTNVLYVGVNKDGSCYYSLTSPAAFRAAASTLAAQNANGYWGMGKPDGTFSDWIRTTSNGLIPYQSGGASSLGTSGWPFNSIYGKAIYLNGTALGNVATKSTNGNTANYLRGDGTWATPPNTNTAKGTYATGTYTGSVPAVAANSYISASASISGSDPGGTITGTHNFYTNHQGVIGIIGKNGSTIYLRNFTSTARDAGYATVTYQNRRLTVST